ncbi:hypothetical protein [Nocardioides panaciterrulae]|uniref:Uncharacterized protein n=1 Tax=Nocardioides panaciterrulae TaxID=661492 RepID=A0A7Y9JCA1_9ACTN|nr:hypothetical protein [Nocardioides panaciterrulae]NYD43193.1 hypothetical protein [Nocardioides panaciterrulae]
MANTEIPDGLPILSRGKHRNPRRGACFMELASVLASERWSDHPACTHPVLAELARSVNDHTSDRHRGDLLPLVPSVIGLRGGGLSWVVDLTAAVALQALPEVSESSMRALVAGLLRCDEFAAQLPSGSVPHAAAVRRALDDRPRAVTWARRLSGGRPITTTAFEKRSAPGVMACAVRGIATSATSEADCDAQLRELLRVGIDTARAGQPAATPERLGGPTASVRYHR